MTGNPEVAPEGVNFFRNYNRVVGAAFLAIMLLTVGFFAYQINEARKEELQVIRGHVERHSQFIEFILRSTTDYLEGLRSVARAHYARTVSPAPERGTASAGAAIPEYLRQRAPPARFDTDELPDRDSGGNLTGLGQLQGRSADFYQDLEMAFALNPSLVAITFQLPSAAEASFVSVDAFAMTSPWQESARRRFGPELYERPIWRMGLPEANPQRERYWASVHFGGADRGLLVPLGVPIYHQDRFRGVMSIETSLDYLNRIHADFGYPQGSALLVDAYGDVLAHASLAESALEQQTTRRLSDILPQALLPELHLDAMPQNVPMQVAGHVVIKHTFISAPWHLLFVIPEQDLWLKLVRERGGAMLAMFLGLTTLIVVMYAVTAREFVKPATQLVQHLALESQFQPSPVPAVPFPWRPWFETISRAFRESLQLLSLRQELDIAAQMQQSILPRHWPEHPVFSLWGLMRSAKEVGGDFYDHFELGQGSLGFVVADVSGKGVPAALFGMVSKTLLQSTATLGHLQLANTVAAVNDRLCKDNDSCMFVTVFFGVFEPDSGRLTYVNAGHPQPLWLRADGSTTFLPLTGGLALGVMDGMDFEQHTVTLAPGDFLLMYSDGVTEALNPQLEEFGSERLLALLADTRPPGVQAAVQRVTQAVDAFADGAAQADDLTCVALHYHPALAVQAIPGEAMP